MQYFKLTALSLTFFITITHATASGTCQSGKNYVYTDAICETSEISNNYIIYQPHDSMRLAGYNSQLQSAFKNALTNQNQQTKIKDTDKHHTIRFNLNEYALTPSQKDDIKAFILSNQYQTIRIIGYTDSIGTQKYNKILSEKRATAVGEYIIEFAPDTVIKAEGQGILDDNPMSRKATIIIKAETTKQDSEVKSEQ